MGKNVYVCDYCGEFVIADGDNKKPNINTKCKICGGNQFHYFVPEKHYHPPVSPKLMQLRFGELIPQWEEHRRHGITLTSGMLPTPKCPICGYNKVRKISGVERGTNAAVFGLFGNKRKYQFECLNPSCGYKW